MGIFKPKEPKDNNQKAVKVKKEKKAKQVNEVKQEKNISKKQQAKNTKAAGQKKKVNPIQKIKEVFSELKKVTWPTFKKVVQQTGIVLAVVFAFFLVIWGIDSLLSYLLKLLVS